MKRIRALDRKRKRREMRTHYRAAAESAWRLGGIPALFNLVQGRGRAVRCPACKGSGVIKTPVDVWEESRDMALAGIKASIKRLYSLTERCAVCSGMGRITPRFAVWHMFPGEVEFVHTVTGRHVPPALMHYITKNRYGISPP